MLLLDLERRFGAAKLFRQLRDLDSVGAKNVWILPVPANFRPNSMKSNLQPKYLTEEYVSYGARNITIHRSH